MSLIIKQESYDHIAKLSLSGALDSSTATLLHEEVQKIIPLNPTEFVMDMENLDFMSSAGLRIIIFAKQKLGPARKADFSKAAGPAVGNFENDGINL